MGPLPFTGGAGAGASSRHSATNRKPLVLDLVHKTVDPKFGSTNLPSQAVKTLDAVSSALDQHLKVRATFHGGTGERVNID